MTDPVKWPTVKRHLVAILRGIRPDEAEAIVGTLIGSGFELIEVPLNSPDPFASIERLAKRFGKDGLIGAGTVLSAADCARVADAGGRLMVAPCASGRWSRCAPTTTPCRQEPARLAAPNRNQQRAGL